MKKSTCVLATFTLVFLFSLTSSLAQSIADLIKQEKRKHPTKETGSKLYTNEDLIRYKNTGAVTTATQAPEGTVDKQKDAADKGTKGAETDAKEASTPESAKKPEDDKSQAKDEEYWRRTLREARDKVQNLENKSNVLQLQLNDLSNKFYREQDVIARERVQKEMQKTMFEIDQNKEQIESAKRSVQDLENEARKASVPPGWIR